MKKVLLIIGALVLLFIGVMSRFQNHADRFVESNETHERELIHDFLSQ
jgi:hypothetical protein